MTKQAVFRLMLATFAVTAFVNTSAADGGDFLVSDPVLNPISDPPPVDVSPRTLRRAIQQSDRTRVARMRMFTVDIRDQIACGKLQDMLEQLVSNRKEQNAGDLCNEDLRYPVRSIVILDQVETNTFREMFARGTPPSSLESTPKRFINERLPVAANTISAGTQLPPISELQQRSVQNLVANDPFNPVLQPIAGTASYKVARFDGKSPLESLGISIANSTVFWEYAEDNTTPTPNAKDLLVNPVVSAVLGEYFYSLEREILSNQGEIMGSRAAGSVAMVVLNPASTIASAMNNAAGKKIIERSRSELLVRRNQAEAGSSNFIGIQLNFEFSNR